MRSKQQLLSPRSSARQVRNIASLELNSYKIDTSSLSQKAKQIQLLKSELQTQISQYKSSQMSYQQDLKHLSDENKQLKGKIKRLQTELNKLKSEPNQSQKNSTPVQIKKLKQRIQDLEQQVERLNKQLTKKQEHIIELQQYKKMYDIEVQNKNNIMNFYQNKLTLFQKDKVTLISKYQQKISQLGSGLQFNGTIIQAGPNLSNLPTPSNTKSNQRLSNFSELGTSKENKDEGQLKISSAKNIKIIRPSKQIKQPEKDSRVNDSIQFQTETPFKMFNIQSNRESRYEKENTPFNRNSRNQINQISISSSLTNNNNNMLVSRKGKNNTSSAHNIKTATSKTLKNNDSFLKLIREIFNNLKRQNIKSETLKNFGAVRTLVNLHNPSTSQVLQMFNSFPFAKIEMDQYEIQESVQRMKKHLQKKYSLWSGNLLIQLLIDKIQDFQIAYEVNSEDECQIVAGLSSDEDDD